MINFDWNDHYKKGGNSGDSEDYKISIPWKKNILFQYCNLKTDSIIDVGCGDLQFWTNELPVRYIGVDISSVIIQKNKATYPDVTFLVSNAASELDISADVVICFDMLFHIIDDDEYIKILTNVKKYAKKYIILYTWNRNIFGENLYYRLLIALVNFKHGKGLSFKIIDGDGKYQKYRDFMKITIPIFEPEFKLVQAHDNTHWKFGTMYVFERCNASQSEVES